jgi:hypothetical protein
MMNVSGHAFKSALHKATVEEKLNEEYCSGLFKSTEGTIYNLEDDVTSKGYINVLDWLEGRVAGLQIFTIRNGIRIPYLRGQKAGIYLDEMPISPGSLHSIPVSDIAIIKVIKTPFMGGINGPGGAIAIYTFRGGDDDKGD